MSGSLLAVGRSGKVTGAIHGMLCHNACVYPGRGCAGNVVGDVALDVHA